MQNFTYENPTKILFGKGMIARIGSEAARFGTKALLVYGSGSIKKNGVYDQVVASLGEAKIPFAEFCGVKSNPVLSHTLKGIEAARGEKVDVIVAVGGGSVIDEAKTIAAGVKAAPGDDIWDFFTFKKKITGALPVLTVLTLSASASEMNNGAVITKEEGAQKLAINSPFIQPKTSILDPSTLFSLTPQYTAYGTVDIIAHMLEGYFNNKEPESPLQDRLVEGLMKTVIESTESILKDPQDYNARANIMWSATLGFNGTTTAGLGFVSYPAHMIEHSLSALYDIAHGAGLSIVLPGWMQYAVQKSPAKFARLAREVFQISKSNEMEQAIAGIDALKSWFASIGSPVSLKQANISGSDSDKIAANAANTAVVWGMKAYTKEVIAQVLSLCK